jgi:hypothetical protein
MEVMIEAQGQIDHLHGFGNDFGTAAEAREKMANVAVVLLDGEGQVFAGEELVFGDETVNPSQSSARKVLPLRPTLSRSF